MPVNYSDGNNPAIDGFNVIKRELHKLLSYGVMSILRQNRQFFNIKPIVICLFYGHEACLKIVLEYAEQVCAFAF